VEAIFGRDRGIGAARATPTGFLAALRMQAMRDLNKLGD